MPTREDTIEALYSLHYDDLLRRACILLHDEEDARDAVSDVMERLMAADILPNEEKLTAYAQNSVRFDAFELFHLCRVARVCYVLVVLVAFLHSFQGGELVLSADAHVAVAPGVGQIELPDVLQHS